VNYLYLNYSNELFQEGASKLIKGFSLKSSLVIASSSMAFFKNNRYAIPAQPFSSASKPFIHSQQNYA